MNAFGCILPVKMQQKQKKPNFLTPFSNIYPVKSTNFGNNQLIRYEFKKISPAITCSCSKF